MAEKEAFAKQMAEKEAFAKQMPYPDLFILSGDHSGGAPPVPIPNTEVKPSSADGTASRWESRSLPGFFSPKDCHNPVTPNRKLRKV